MRTTTYFYLITSVLLAVASACSNDPGKSEQDDGGVSNDTGTENSPASDSDADADADTDTDADSDTGTSTGTDADADTDTETETGTDPLPGPCVTLHDYFVDTCHYPSLLPLFNELDNLCRVVDQSTSDSFVNAYVGCLTALPCDAYEEDGMDAGPPGPDAGTDAGASEPADPFDSCFNTVSVTATPGSEAQALRTEYCEFLVLCDPSVTSQTTCEADFWQGDLGMAKLLDEKYLNDAIACFGDPLVCANSVGTCLKGVLASVPLFTL